MMNTTLNSLLSSGRFTLIAVAALALCPCGHRVLAGGAPPPTFSDPLDITNTFQPFVPGGMKIFAGEKDGAATVIVDRYLEVTRDFAFNAGMVSCHILQETELEDGELSEISLNFFAQADDGAVYYFGEIVDKYRDGVVVGHPGSWLVGGATDPGDPVNTANAPAPNVFMPANPMVGDVFKPEDLAPTVDESDKVKEINATVNTHAGQFTGAIRIRESSSLDEDIEIKWYAPDVGVVKGKASGDERFSLVYTSFGL